MPVYLLFSGGKSHIALKFYIDKYCPKCQVVTGVVCCLWIPLLKMAPVFPVELVSCGAGANLAGSPRSIVGAEVSGLRSMVQGAATRLAGLECWAVFNQGIQAPGFLFSFFLSSLAKRRAYGHGHTSWQKGLTVADWKIEKVSER